VSGHKKIHCSAALGSASGYLIKKSHHHRRGFSYNSRFAFKLVYTLLNEYKLLNFETRILRPVHLNHGNIMYVDIGIHYLLLQKTNAFC